MSDVFDTCLELSSREFGLIMAVMWLLGLFAGWLLF